MARMQAKEKAEAERRQRKQDKIVQKAAALLAAAKQRDLEKAKEPEKEK